MNNRPERNPADRSPEEPGRDVGVGRSPRRWLLAGLGVLCVGLGLLGAVVPGLPTTVFLIVASYLFARSCPWLEERLLGLPVFRPYMRYVRGDAAIPRRARVAALAMMWTAVATSLALLAVGDALAPWLAATVLIAAVAGTVTILRWRPARVRSADSPR